MNKRINFNIKDRKVLYVILAIALISTFTLTIAYAALNTILTISGNAEVVATNWDIHMENPVVKSGSATTTVPSINGNTLTFSTTLNMPGDFYEFTVDVVNSGSIDAMIENVTKTPELTTEQAKYFKYEVSYANGTNINSSQLLAKETTMPIKVRVEYRKDLTSGNLPSSSSTINLGLKIVYTQSNGNTNNVANNGYKAMVTANGYLNKLGTIVTIESEQFYTIGIEGDNVKLLSKYNLDAGGTLENSYWSEYDEEFTSGLQSGFARGYVENQSIHMGVLPFSNDYIKGVNYSDYSGSKVEYYVNNYKNKLKEFGVNIIDARLITAQELMDQQTFKCVYLEGCSTDYPWIYATSYWTGTPTNDTNLWGVGADNTFEDYIYYQTRLGVRPVIIMDKNDIIESVTITFTIAGVSYQAMNGMTWEEWLASDYAPANAYSNYTGGNEVVSVAGYDVKTSGGTYVTPSDTIISGHAYAKGQNSEPR